MNREKRHLDALTGIRFFAALMVLAFHVWPGSTDPGGSMPFYKYGNLGVSLFFVLSGFILGYNYLDRAGSIRLGDFYWKRFARIYPVYLLGALFAVLWVGKERGFGTSFREFAVTAPLVQAWSGKYALSGNGVGWSLSVEALFYASFPWFARGIARLDARRAALCLAALLVATFLPFALCRVLPGVAPDAYDRLVRSNVCLPLLHLPEFVAGVLLARVYGLQTTLLPAWASDALAVVALALIWLFGMSPWRVSGEQYATGGLILPFALLIYALSQRPGQLSRFLGSRPLVLLGEASFALYIIHTGVQHVTPNALGPWKPAIVTVVAIFLSILILFRVEQPARIALLDWSERRRRRVASAGTP